MEESADNKPAGAQIIDIDSLRTLKHDINNQLTNIVIALEQLKYEVPYPSEDCIFYINSISISSAKINTLLNQLT
jgi:hypothetical protein